MRKLTITILVLIMSFCVGTVSAQNTHVLLDHVDGLYDGKIKPDVPIKFHIRWQNFSDLKMNITSGYRIFLRDNTELTTGTFQPIKLDTLAELHYESRFDLSRGILHYGADGVGSDTAAFKGVFLSGEGFPSGWDTVAVTISTSVSSMSSGDSLCIDSSFIPVGTWKWSSISTTEFPTWSGPHCFEILPSCCIG